MTLSHLRELEQRATGAPWHEDYPGIGGPRKGLDVLSLEWGYYDDCSLVLSENDRALIVALRNAAPALIDAVEALKFYAAQSSWCESYSAVTMLRSRSETDNDKGAKARTALAALEAS